MESKVFIVDDEAHIRRLLRQTLEDLEDEGIEILEAEDGETGLELIKAERPALVFLDVMMPNMDGFDVCRAVKHDLAMQDVYIVVLTSKGQEFDKQRGEEAGADIYMTKPFNPNELFQIAQEVLGI
jgi:DNA-binding response OmpR family regulator